MKKPRNLSIILTVVSGIGMVATCIAVARIAPKAEQKLQKAKEDKGEDLTPVEKVTTVATDYIPAVLIGASTMACMVGSTILDRKEQASLSSAIALGGNYVQKYKGKIKDFLGQETEKKIEEEVREELEVEHPDETDFTVDLWNSFASDDDTHANQSEDNPGTPMLFYDLSSGTMFKKTLEQVLLAEYFLNRSYILNSEATLTDWYNYLGIDPVTDCGDQLMWTVLDTGDEWIDFKHVKKTTNDGRDYYEIEIVTEPYNLDELPIR